MKRDRKLLEKLQKDNLLNFYLVSLISSDTLESIDDCDRVLKEIDFLKEILPENNIDNKEHYEKLINDGEIIILRDKAIFSKKR